MQLEVAFNPPPFVWPYQPPMGGSEPNASGPPGGSARRPETQEVWRQIIVLPDIGSQYEFKMGDSIKDMRGGMN